MTPRMDGHYGGGAEAFGFNEDTVRRYTEGWCWELALSLSEMTGWPAAWVEGSKGMHAFIVSPSGTMAVDVLGIRPLEEMLEDWDVIPTNFVVASSYGEAQRELKEWDLGLNPTDDRALTLMDVTQRIVRRIEGRWRFLERRSSCSVTI